MTIQFRLLGEFQVLDGGTPLDIRRGQDRGVLIALLVDVNKIVPMDVLADRVWGDSQPQNARAALYTYVSRVRSALAGTGDVSIDRQSGGYLLAADPHTVDLHRFQDLVARARVAVEDGDKVVLLQDALDLWTGEPLTGANSPWMVTLREVLLTQRHAARLDLADAMLRRGEHTRLIPQLVDLAAVHRLDERLAGQLMLAYYRDGRQQDALGHYDRIRRDLAEELGVDPGPRLRELHQQILAADTDLLPPSNASVPLVPQQLLGAPRQFVGRVDELDRLTRVVDDGAGAAVVISAIGGAGGVGKTWLALHWTHQHSDRFPDGQLFVNLRGYDPSGQPTAPETALRGFLEALGVDPAAIPSGLDAQSALYRSVTATKRLLVVLDNAVDAAQVSPLLPGGRDCTVLITSRDRLAELMTAFGAVPLPLDVFSRAEARDLLRARLGAQRLLADPGAVEELLDRCAGLPLALSIVAGRAQVHPEFPLAVFAAELRDVAAFDERDVGVRAVLSWSVAALSPGDARAFGQLGLVPGPDIDVFAAAALTDLPVAEVRVTLRALERVSLVAEHVPGRYRMHDLTRSYAAEQALDQDAAERRLVDFYLHTAYAGDMLLNPHRGRVELESSAVRPLPLADQAAAVAWFDDEHACVVAVLHLAARRGWHLAVWHLAWSLTAYHTRRGYRTAAVEVGKAALASAGHLDSPMFVAQAHRLLGHAHNRADEFDLGNTHLYAALELSEPDPLNQAYLHHTLSQAWERQGKYKPALDHARQALALFEPLDLTVWMARSQNQIGWLAAHLGDFDEARVACTQALKLFNRDNDLDGKSAALDTMGYIACQSDRYLEAVDYYTQALDLARELGHIYYEADTLERLAEVHQALGDTDKATVVRREALALFETQQRLADVERLRDLLSGGD